VESIFAASSAATIMTMVSWLQWDGCLFGSRQAIALVMPRLYVSHRPSQWLKD
jgi:hypothetical protein